jgi:hypothetical protein
VFDQGMTYGVVDHKKYVTFTNCHWLIDLCSNDTFLLFHREPLLLCNQKSFRTKTLNFESIEY